MIPKERFDSMVDSHLTDQGLRSFKMYTKHAYFYDNPGFYPHMESIINKKYNSPNYLINMIQGLYNQILQEEHLIKINLIKQAAEL